MNASSLKIYKASAGSGKTYTLAKEFVKILIQNPHHYKNILAITFTKKATAEMKNRILFFLQQIKENKNPQLTQDIINEIKEEQQIDVAPHIHEQAEKAINLILHDYGHLQVTTIDSFFQLIIRSFARELRLPIGMQVELETDIVLDKSVTALLEESAETNEVSEWLEKFALDNIDNEKDWKIEKTIVSLGKELLKEEYILLNEHFGEIRKTDFEKYKKTADEQQKILSDYKKYIRTKGKEIEEIVKQSDINTKLFSRDSLNGFLKKIKETKIENYTTLQKMIDGKAAVVSKENFKKYPEEAAKVCTVWEQYLSNILYDILHYHEENIRQYHSANSILKNIYAMALLDALSNKISAYRTQENVILISDASYFISKIADAEATPFIFEKTSSFINYILIDEFQDTSTLQWRSLMPIVVEILSKGFGLSLIVGDAKQSIYRWRGGKMELIITKIDEDIRPFLSLKKEIILNNNFRSLTNIINFNNTFFDNAVVPYHNLELLKKAYSEQAQYQTEENENKKNGGLIRCSWIEEQKKELPTDEQETTEVSAILTALTERLQQLEQRCNWKDIAILVRTNKEGIAIANHLQQLKTQIPFVSGESLLIANNLNVQLIIASLEFLVTTESFYKYKLENLYCNYIGEKNYNEILQKKDKFEFEQCFIENKIDVKQLKNSKLVDAVHTLLHIYKMDKESNAYIVRLLDDIYQFTQKKGNHIIQYLYYWQEKQEKISVLPPEEADAVKIITIHKSKGLEYPVVLIPFANWSLFPKPNSIFWTKDEKQISDTNALPLSFLKILEETEFNKPYEREKELSIIDNINMLYVAFTRAEKELHIFCKKKTNDKQTEAKDIGDIIKQTLQTETLKQYFIDELEFIFGNPAKFEKKVRKDEVNYLKLVTINIEQNYPLNSSSYYDEYIKKGDIIHALAVNIHLYEVQRPAFHKIQYQFLLSDEEILSYNKIIESIYQLLKRNNLIHQEYTYLYERDFYFNNSVRRADLVIITPTENIILDYKTGIEEKQHQQQLKIYKDAYEAMTNKPTKAFLCYTETLKLISI